MDKKQLREYINNCNELTNTNSESYRKAREILLQTGNINDPEIRELITLAKNKNLI